MHPNPWANTLAVVVGGAAFVGLIYIYATGRKRSARWRERTIARQGYDGYRRRRIAYQVTPWVVILAGVIVIGVLQHLKT